MWTTCPSTNSRVTTGQVSAGSPGSRALPPKGLAHISAVVSTRYFEEVPTLRAVLESTPRRPVSDAS